MTDLFPFVVGCPRSGTTLARVILEEHPALAVFPESRFVTRYARHRERYESNGHFDHALFMSDVLGHEKAYQWRLEPDRVRARLEADAPRDYPEAVRSVFRAYADQQGKPAFGDKTPTYVMDIVLLAKLFGEARFVHVIRDGRNVALSLVENPFGPTTPAEGILYWAHRVQTARAAARLLPRDRYLEYRHEDLIADPAAVVQRMCAFLGIPFEPAMLEYHQRRASNKHYGSRNLDKPPTSLRDWRTQIEPEQLRVCEILAGDLLSELGYELTTSPATHLAREVELQREATETRARQAAFEHRWWRRVNRAPAKRAKEDPVEAS